MLVSFSIQNYRSFASRQTFSMVAGVGSRKDPRRAFATGNSLAPHLLRTACLFGPNASGKSTVVMALKFFREFVISSAKDSQEGEPINVTPFKFDDEWNGKPSEFEITFIHEEALYQYGFSVDSERVWEEWLFSKPNKPRTQTRNLFQRTYDPDSKAYHWEISKTHLKGEKSLWQRSTRENALFLSTAVQLGGKSLNIPYIWIAFHLTPLDLSITQFPLYTIKMSERPNNKEIVIHILRSIDINIIDYQFDCLTQNIHYDPKNCSDDESLIKTYNIMNEKEKLHKMPINIETYHMNKSGKKFALDYYDESDGTQAAFSLSGFLLSALHTGSPILVDELNRSLHPHALRFLVGLFHNPEINKNNAQLIFTSHETYVMAQGFMHQDQIWFAEKNADEQSELFPLSDFKVRDTTAFQKAYLEGRYGAVPRIKSMFEMKKRPKAAPDMKDRDKDSDNG